MSIKFYYGSGSPFSWNVWLVLEHKQLPYEFNLLSLQNGDLKKPAYLAINPHGKVPVIIDDGFTLWEASTIVEYLDEQYPDNPVFPRSTRDKAMVRRLSAEASNYFYPPLRRLMEQTLLRSDKNSDPAEIEAAMNGLKHELSYFNDMLENNYFAGQLSAADFTIYPLLALIKRIHTKLPELGAGTLLQPKLNSFMQRIKQLPYYSKTYPPHWKA